MKAIIDGKRYNTETAIKIGSDSYGSGRDFHAWEATLYKTKNGNYFLAGSGGAMSSYGKQIGQNQWGGGSRIDPMTRTEAFEWSQEHLSPTQVEEYFGDMLEDA